MLHSVVISSCGFGERFRGYVNPQNCKGLIRSLSDVPLLSYTLEAVKEANIAENILIIGKESVESELRLIADRSGLKYTYLNGYNVRSIPEVISKFEVFTEKQPFMFICGNSTPTASHLRKMLSVRHSKFEPVTSCYSDSVNRTRVVLKKHSSTVEKFIPSESKEYEDVRSPYLYLECPHIITEDIVLDIKKDRHKDPIEQYFNRFLEKGVRFHSVQAGFPHDANNEEELHRTMMYLDRSSTQRRGRD